MANLKVNANFIVPENFDIHLVRADVMHVSATFRVCFEVALSLTSTLMGYILSLQSPLPVHWVFFGVSAIATVAFLVLSHRKQCEATVQG